MLLFVKFSKYLCLNTERPSNFQSFKDQSECRYKNRNQLLSEIVKIFNTKQKIKKRHIKYYFGIFQCYFTCSKWTFAVLHQYNNNMVMYFARRTCGFYDISYYVLYREQGKKIYIFRIRWYMIHSYRCIVNVFAISSPVTRHIIHARLISIYLIRGKCSIGSACYISEICPSSSPRLATRSRSR